MRWGKARTETMAATPATGSQVHPGLVTAAETQVKRCTIIVLVIGYKERIDLKDG